jgi:hypothetical protein
VCSVGKPTEQLPNNLSFAEIIGSILAEPRWLYNKIALAILLCVR